MSHLADSLYTQAVDILNAGGVVAMPTETVYGLAARIDSPEGLKKIFELKKRPLFDPLIVHVRNQQDALELLRSPSDWNETVHHLALRFWPGPLTFVLPKSEKVDPLITSGLGTVALRCPKHHIAQEVLSRVGVPLAAPSANRFGRLSPSRAEHVHGEFRGQDLLVLDGGPSEVGIESTVIQVLDASTIHILRPGAVTKTDISESLKTLHKEIEIKEVSTKASPGHMEHHYQPDQPLALLKPEQKTLTEDERKIVAHQIKKSKLKMEHISLTNNPLLACRSMYHLMRLASQKKPDLILLSLDGPISNNDLWHAILNRLGRAATFDFWKFTF